MVNDGPGSQLAMNTENDAPQRMVAARTGLATAHRDLDRSRAVVAEAAAAAVLDQLEPKLLGRSQMAGYELFAGGS